MADAGDEGGGAPKRDDDPFHLRDSVVDGGASPRVLPSFAHSVRPTAPLDEPGLFDETGPFDQPAALEPPAPFEEADAFAEPGPSVRPGPSVKPGGEMGAALSVVPLPTARAVGGPGFVDHGKPIDPWNEVTPTELPDEEDAYFASDVRIVPVDDLPEIEVEPLTPSMPIATLAPGTLEPSLRGLTDHLASNPYAADLFDGDGPFAAPLDAPRSEVAVRVSELRSFDAPLDVPYKSVDPRTPLRPPPPRAPSLRSDIASQLAAPILVERRVGTTPTLDAELTEAEVAVVPRAPSADVDLVPVAPRIGAPVSPGNALVRTSGPDKPASEPISSGSARGSGPNEPGVRRPAATRSGGATPASGPALRGSGGSAKASFAHLPAERQYPKMRALLKNPDAVPYGSEEPSKRKAPPVPGTFFPTPRREPYREAKAAPADLDEMLATMAEGLLIGESPTGGTEVRVTLRDEFFAGTELRITVGDGRVRATLHPPDRGTYLTLNGNIDDLRRRLEDRGLRIEELRVADP